MTNFRKLMLILGAAAMLFASACGQKSGTPGNDSGATAGQNEKDYSDEVDADKFPYEAQNYAPTVKNHLTDYPNYALPADATEDECRAMVVKAMNDELTFPWAPIKSFQYKVSAGASRDLNYDFTALYGGLPYNNRARSLFHALAWYDFETGYMYAEDFESGNSVFGNTCANSVIWGQAAVCPTVSAVSTHTVTPGHGYTIRGNLKGTEGLMAYSDAQNTDWILAQNSDEDVFKAYAECKPGDSLLTHGSPKCGNHNMMVTGVDTAYKADGTIDPDASIIHIQDQWGSLYYQETDGENVQYCGRHKDFAFRYFLDNDYVPYSPTELYDFKGHEVLTYSITNENPTFKDIRSTKLNCNYRICTVTCRIISESGTCVLKKTSEYTDYTGTYGLAGAVPLAGDIEDVLVEGRTYTMEMKACAADGEILNLFEIPISKADLAK